MKKAAIYLGILTAIMVSGCVEKNIPKPQVPVPVETGPSAKEKPFDELYTYAKGLYYWNDKITMTRQEARDYSKRSPYEYDNLKALLNSIKGFSGGQDKYSIIQFYPKGELVAFTEAEPQKTPKGKSYESTVGGGIPLLP